jgi:hypothetical protein
MPLPQLRYFEIRVPNVRILRHAHHPDDAARGVPRVDRNLQLGQHLGERAKGHAAWSGDGHLRSERIHGHGSRVPDDPDAHARNLLGGRGMRGHDKQAGGEETIHGDSAQRRG